MYMFVPFALSFLEFDQNCISHPPLSITCFSCALLRNHSQLYTKYKDLNLIKITESQHEITFTSQSK